jgi:hypothetical protein
MEDFEDFQTKDGLETSRRAMKFYFNLILNVLMHVGVAGLGGRVGWGAVQCDGGAVIMNLRGRI